MKYENQCVKKTEKKIKVHFTCEQIFIACHFQSSFNFVILCTKAYLFEY